MTRKGPVDLSGMDRSFFEALSPEARVELLCRLHALAIEREAGSGFLVATTVVRRPLRPGIGDLDWRGAARAIGLTARTGTPSPLRAQARQAARQQRDPAVRKPGKRRGRKGSGRCEPLQAERDENHYPTLCAACATPFEMWDRQSGHSAHFVLDLERAAGGIRIACVRHRYHALECACGVRTAARPG